MDSEQPVSSDISADPNLETTAERLGKRQLRWIVVTALIVLVISSVVTTFIVSPPNSSAFDKVKYSLAYFLAAFSANLAAAAAAYIFSYMWRRGWTRIENDRVIRSLQSQFHRVLVGLNNRGIIEYSTVWDPSLPQSIAAANFQIDVCVQGWDSLVKRSGQQWQQFFRKEGTVNLILPSPTNQGIVFMAERMKKKEEEQKKEISNTFEALKELRDEVGTGEIVPHYVSNMIWYCMIRIDKKIAFVSFYEHSRSGKAIKAPMYRIELDDRAKTGDWIDKELDFLFEIAKREKQTATNNEAAAATPK